MSDINILIQNFFSDEFIPVDTESKNASSKSLNATAKLDKLSDLKNRCTLCTACPLHASATNPVFGSGSLHAKLMIIGEAPGADEDKQGIPFVGRAGQLLITTLEKFGMKRDDVYITNILKHRPPENRNPLPKEIEACTPFLRKQIALISPKLLLTLGNFSSQFILKTTIGITKIRGSIQESEFGMVLATLHPSAIIRGAYPKDLLEKDIQTALTYIDHAIDKN